MLDTQTFTTTSYLLSRVFGFYPPPRPLMPEYPAEKGTFPSSHRIRFLNLIAPVSVYLPYLMASEAEQG